MAMPVFGSEENAVRFHCQQSTDATTPLPMLHSVTQTFLNRDAECDGDDMYRRKQMPRRAPCRGDWQGMDTLNKSLYYV